MYKTFNIEDFQPHLLSQFSLFYAEDIDPLTVELIKIDEFEYARPKDLGKGFSLEFLGPSKTVLPQAIYQLEHSTMGTLNIFMVPVESTPQGMIYQSIFN